MCEQQWEAYDPLSEQYELLVRGLQSWQSRASYKRQKRHDKLQQSCADIFRYPQHFACTNQYECSLNICDLENHAVQWSCANAMALHGMMFSCIYFVGHSRRRYADFVIVRYCLTALCTCSVTCRLVTYNTHKRSNHGYIATNRHLKPRTFPGFHA